MKKDKLPHVVIVGRTNVGKSTLFNRLSEDVKSITYDAEGITRDFLSDVVCWKETCFELIDTGGISLRKTSDAIIEKVRQQALALLEDATVILFMIDAKAGVLPEDKEIARALHKMNKKIVLVVNKIDTKQAREHEYEYAQLGFKETVGISAQHGIGIADLFDAILSHIPKQITYVEETPKCRVVILGKPNVGKSSLLNVLLKEERSIVADIPGTTREPIQAELTFYKESIQLTDTPGLRKKKKIDDPIEQLMAKTALKAVDRADIVLLVVDANEGTIVDQELKLAFYVFEQEYKGLIIIFNKDDLVDEQKMAHLQWTLEPYAFFMDKIPQLRISCKTKKNIGKLLELIMHVAERYYHQFTNEDLTFLFKDALMRRPLYRNQQMLRVHRARQVRTGPITIELFVNEPKWFGPSQLAFFEGVLRDHADLKGAPIRFVVQKAE